MLYMAELDRNTKYMRSLEIIGLAHGPLLGVQYFPKEDQEEDWNELNIYLLLICIKIIF